MPMKRRLISSAYLSKRFFDRKIFIWRWRGLRRAHGIGLNPAEDLQCRFEAGGGAASGGIAVDGRRERV